MLSVPATSHQVPKVGQASRLGNDSLSGMATNAYSQIELKLHRRSIPQDDVIRMYTSHLVALSVL